ncbi:MAG: Asp-tRNA(Asn)/Glu-tRNA(Gln) amidotransferase subunit GatB [Bacteroidetes bacterium]|nr:MAG: Asp-tRNA(Asn)/Glu-tRNA(Gln) amidotransferase subunit GatB [Bacteroidota bacterium]
MPKFSSSFAAMQYQTVIGLEVHIQLNTASKLFCADAASFGSAPNTHVSPVTLAHPGSLPVLNQTAIDYAVRLGLALGCHISSHSFFDRKHYFYPDLPKAYQTSQQTHPILSGGSLLLKSGAVPIHHIHLEEDAGKSIHDADAHHTCIDLNRAGVPLLELVTDPALHSSQQAFDFITELRRLVRWLSICDGNMEEGSLRCDANISIKPQGQTTLGTKVEVKNLNSIRNVKRAIDAEVARQTQLLESGQAVVQQTRGYDADRNTTLPQRDKEEANDYRYFPCPDLPPIQLSEAYIQNIASTMPALPQALEAHYTQALGLPQADAEVLAEDKTFSDYFNALTAHTPHAKPAANWMLGPLKSWCNDAQQTLSQFPIAPAHMAQLVNLVQDGSVSFSAAATRLLPAFILAPTTAPAQLANQLGLVQTSNTEQLQTWVSEAIAAMPDKVKEYQKGKKGLIGLFVGEVKKRSGGKADPQAVMQMLQAQLANATV